MCWRIPKPSDGQLPPSVVMKLDVEGREVKPFPLNVPKNINGSSFCDINQNINQNLKKGWHLTGSCDERGFGSHRQSDGRLDGWLEGRDAVATAGIHIEVYRYTYIHIPVGATASRPSSHQSSRPSDCQCDPKPRSSQDPVRCQPFGYFWLIWQKERPFCFVLKGGSGFTSLPSTSSFMTTDGGSCPSECLGILQHNI